MLLAIVGSTVMSGLLTYTFLDQHGTTEAIKIQRIAANCGLHVKEGGEQRTIHLLRRKYYHWGVEYSYRIPLGLSFDDFKKKQRQIEDGLNHKRGFFEITLDDIKKLKIRPDILKQIKKLFRAPKGKKEVVMEYDGTLKIRIYREPMPEMVPFDDAILESCRGWQISLGTSREEPVFHDFEKIPHMVVAGTTRYGKSVFLKNVITTLIHTQPKAANFTLIDLKGGLAFNRFKDAVQVLEVAKDVEESRDVLLVIQKEMKARQTEFLRRGFEDVKEAKMRQRHFIIIDEAAELANQGEPDKDIKKMKIECEKIISEVARIGGGLGYRLIFATQYPTADTLPRQVKQNCDARLCFRLQTEVASQVVLDESGAENLPFIKGRAIYRTDRRQMVQTPFIDNDFIDRTIKPHIVIKPRKEQTDGDTTKETPAGRSYSLIIEET